MTQPVAVDSVFTALGDPTRRQILEHLGVHGQASATKLAQLPPVSRQAIAKHLKILEQSGLVYRQVKGKEVCFKAEPNQLAATGRWLQRKAKQWDENTALS